MSAARRAGGVASFDPDLPGQGPSVGAAFVYVLPCHGENLLKLGFSRDPLERMAAFHPRYFEFFDLRRAFAIELDRVSEARQLERHLAAPLHEHRASAPLTVRDAAAGRTEWYRGAYGLLEQQARRAQFEGRQVHLPLLPWLRRRLQQRADLLFDWSQRLLDDIELDRSEGALLSQPLQDALVNALDALHACGIAPTPYFPRAVLDWRAAAVAAGRLHGSAHAA